MTQVMSVTLHFRPNRLGSLRCCFWQYAQASDYRLLWSYATPSYNLAHTEGGVKRANEFTNKYSGLHRPHYLRKCSKMRACQCLRSFYHRVADLSVHGYIVNNWVTIIASLGQKLCRVLEAFLQQIQICLIRHHALRYIRALSISSG